MSGVSASGGQHVTGPAPYERAYRSERSRKVYGPGRPTRRVCAYYDSPVDVLGPERLSAGTGWATVAVRVSVEADDRSARIAAGEAVPLPSVAIALRIGERDEETKVAREV